MRFVRALAWVFIVGCQGDPVGETSVDSGKGGAPSGGGADGSAASSGSGGTGAIAGSGASGGTAGTGGSLGGSGGVAGSAGSSGSGGTGGVLVPDPGGANGLALDDSNVYFGIGKDIWRVPKTGGAKTWVTSGMVSVREIEVAGGFVYFLDGNKTIRRAPTTGASAVMVTQGSGSFEEYGDIASDGAYVYFTTTTDKTNFAGAVMRVAVTGGVPFEIHEVISAGEPHGIFLLGSEVFWTQHLNGVIYKAPIAGGNATLLAQGLAGPWKVAANSELMYWTESSGSAAYKTYGSIEIVVPATGPGDDIVIDAINAYFTSPSAGKVYGAPLKTKSASVIADCNVAGSLAIDATSVYATCGGTPGAVIKIGK